MQTDWVCTEMEGTDADMAVDSWIDALERGAYESGCDMPVYRRMKEFGAATVSLRVAPDDLYRALLKVVRGTAVQREQLYPLVRWLVSVPERQWKGSESVIGEARRPVWVKPTRHTKPSVDVLRKAFGEFNKCEEVECTAWPLSLVSASVRKMVIFALYYSRGPLEPYQSGVGCVEFQPDTYHLCCWASTQ